jgi:hypothetical protein
MAASMAAKKTRARRMATRSTVFAFGRRQRAWRARNARLASVPGYDGA